MSRLVIQGVRFRYRSFGFRNLRMNAMIGPIDCVLENGLYSLIGSNGSGKSTLLKLIAGIMLPDEGTIALRHRAGSIRHPVLKQWIGYMPQAISVYEQMTVMEYMHYIGKLKLIPADELADRVQASLSDVRLEENASQTIRSLSAGMRRRLMLAQALLGQPGILLLDEPFTSLDIEERNDVLDLLAGLAEGRIIIAAHHLTELIAPPFHKFLKLREGRMAESNVGTTDYALI